MKHETDYRDIHAQLTMSPEEYREYEKKREESLRAFKKAINFSPENYSYLPKSKTPPE